MVETTLSPDVLAVLARFNRGNPARPVATSCSDPMWAGIAEMMESGLLTLDDSRDEIQLTARGVAAQRGAFPHNMVVSMRPRDRDQIVTLYPRLIRAMSWCACLSPYEAASAIRDRRDGYTFAGEAVSHYGRGEPDVNAHVIGRAFKARHIVRRYNRGQA